MKKILSFIFLISIVHSTQGQWTTISIDELGDPGLDATLLEYQHDALTDSVHFRVTCANLSTYSSGPSADFSFQLPNGLASGNASGTHWTSTTAVHKTAFIYCDPGGSAPDNYTYSQWSQRIEETSTMVSLCSDCVDIFVDVPADQITYSFDRKDIITDTEMGGSTATIGIVANVGHDVGWDDAITHAQGGASTATFDLALAVSVPDIDASNGFSVYPNPVSEILFLEDHVEAIAMSIIDISGKVLTEISRSSFIDGIDISQLAKGMYILQIHGENGLLGQVEFIKD